MKTERTKKFWGSNLNVKKTKKGSILLDNLQLDNYTDY